MTTWISPRQASGLPSGWYATLSDWNTASLHPGAHFWLGSKWASSCPERIVSVCPDRFEDPHEASSHAFSLEMAMTREPAPMALAAA